MEVRETQQMRYQIGYDYYWNCFESFRFQGKVVEGACINVLFSPILTCKKEDYEKNDVGSSLLIPANRFLFER